MAAAIQPIYPPAPWAQDHLQKHPRPHHRPKHIRQGLHGPATSDSMTIADRLLDSEPSFSFEFFAPKTPKGHTLLLKALEDLQELSPGFVSVTCGASGTSRGPSLETVKELQSMGRFRIMAHLTCMGQTSSALLDDLRFLRSIGVENVLALRGDPPAEELGSMDSPAPRSAEELIRFIRENGFGFCIGGAAYPECHPKAVSPDADIQALKAKVDAGASFLITQLFFDNDVFFRFLDRARAAGIQVPIIPGIMPVTSYEQLERFRTQCGVRSIPEKFQSALERHRNSAEAIQEIGVAFATSQCMDLLRRGVRHLHFFTLNRSPATRSIVIALKA